LNGDEALHDGKSLGMFGGYLPAGEGEHYGGPQLDEAPQFCPVSPLPLLR